MKHVLDLKCMAMFMLSFDVTVPVVFVSDGKVGMDKLSKVATSIYKNAPPPHFQKRGGCAALPQWPDAPEMQSIQSCSKIVNTRNYLYLRFYIWNYLEYLWRIGSATRWEVINVLYIWEAWPYTIVDKVFEECLAHYTINTSIVDFERE